ncbi:MAG TPA: hypothetical protein VKA65_15420 [Acidimicrobiales bacterium]|nr:hypothetical protein [Acidimicrobiales bacterium]
MADQAVSSLSNVVVTIIVAGHVTRDEFGAFSVALVAYQLASVAVRATVGEPYLSAHSTDTGAARATAAGDLLRASLAASVLASSVMAVAALAVGGDAAAALLALALVFPFLGAQDALRHVAVVDRPHLALASDGVWLAGVAVLVVVAPGDASAAWFVAAWGVAGIAGLAVAIATMDVPWRGDARRWARSHREMAGAFLAESVSARAAGQVVQLALGAIAGLPALGAVRAAQTFYGPLNTLYAGIYLALVPDGARKRDEPAKLLHFMLVASAVVTTGAALWALVGVFLPDAWGTAVFGDTWREAEELMVPTGLAVIAGSAATGAFAGLRSLGAARHSLRARLWSLPPEVACALGGAVVGGAVGYSYGFAAGNLVMAAIWWTIFLAALRHRARHPGLTDGADPGAAPPPAEASSAAAAPAVPGPPPARASRGARK